MTNSNTIYKHNDVLYSELNIFFQEIFEKFFHREKYRINKNDFAIKIGERYTTWLICKDIKEHMHLEFPLYIIATEIKKEPSENVLINAPMYIKIYASDEVYDRTLESYKKYELLNEPDDVLTHSQYQKLLYVMIKENTLENIKIRYPYNSFKFLNIQSFKDKPIYHEYFERTINYFKLLDKNVKGHVEINIKNGEIISTNIIELSINNSSFHYPSQFDPFFNKNFENRETLFLYYSTLLKIFYQIDIDSLELMNNFEDKMKEIENTINLLKY